MPPGINRGQMAMAPGYYCVEEVLLWVGYRQARADHV